VIKAVDGWTSRHLNAGLHAVSGEVAADAARNLRIDRASITVIGRGRSRARLGVPGEARRVRVRAALGIPPTAPLIVCVGRQEHQKSHVTLIDAWAEIAATRLDARLVIAGRPGLATPDIESALARLDEDARRRVERLGHIEEVGDLLAASDVFAFPSLFEGFGGALVEALALGVPIVASDLEVFREFLVSRVHALLVPPRDSGALAEAITEILGDEVLARSMSRANVKLFDARFALEPVVDQMATLYRRLSRQPSS
jgi:glycosyltransferase involved in cell wall biosynthesis